MRGAARFIFAMACVICLCAAVSFAAAPAAKTRDIPSERLREEDLLRHKAALLMEKAQKAERRGEYAEAVEAYEDAYEAFSGNVMPLLAWGDLLCRLGQYREAQAVLKRIPLTMLPSAGQARVHLMFAKTSAAAGVMSEAAGFFGDALKAQPENATARIRLALLNDHFGSRQRAAELLEGLQDRESIGYRDRVILFMLELSQLDPGNALADAFLLSEQFAVAPVSIEEGSSWFGGILNMAPVSFIMFLPIGFSGVPGMLYAVLLLGSLAFLAARQAPAASPWGSVAFVILAAAHVGVAWNWGIPDARLAMLVDGFSVYDTIWIIPRLLLAMHLTTILLFGVFPLLSLLPERVRPKRNELFAVWFFCWWFMMSVLVFQGRLDLTVRLPGLLGSLALMIFASGWMPLGRFWIYHFAKATGFSRLMPAFGTDGSATSFIDAKLQEAQAVSRLEAEEFAGVIEIGRRLFSAHDQAAFPGMWLSMIRAHIEQEDFYEGEKMLKGFQSRFGNSNRADEGVLLESLYKSMTGDFAGALKAINMIPDERARKFGSDDAALSLLVIGRCNVFFDQAIQAHIDWTRALDHARLPLVRACILVELALQDASMNRREWTDKWAAKAKALGGGAKTRALVKTVESIALAVAGRPDDALKLAREACDCFPRCGVAYYWQGHLLCLSEKQSMAESLLDKMVAGTVAAERLMQEITARRSCRRE